jgi:hypothetical protein
MVSECRFWMVYGEGQRSPTYKHASRALAETEAARLAKANPSIAFYVLKATEIIIASAPEVRGYKLERRPTDASDDGIPF